MQSEQAFLTQLRTATKRWMQAGLLDERQAAQILDYECRSPQNAAVSAAANSVDSDHAGFQSYIPAILIGIAVLLIGVGLIFFYAANWKWMSPLTKIIQIFALIILLYTAAGYMLFIRRTHLFTGRGLLMLGMIAYGAGIGLIAQVYHISSHPTNAVMVWLLGVLAVSMVMREKWGYYLALLLALIWHSWEYFEYDNPGYVAIVFPLLLGFLFYKERVLTS